MKRSTPEEWLGFQGQAMSGRAGSMSLVMIGPLPPERADRQGWNERG
jgi:hypothetical protein